MGTMINTCLLRRAAFDVMRLARNGGHLGPSLQDVGPVLTPILWVQTMWNHAPAMEGHMREVHIAWPRFDGEEMSDLLAFVRYERGGTEAEAKVFPASPKHGWILFQQKGCIS